LLGASDVAGYNSLVFVRTDAGKRSAAHRDNAIGDAADGGIVRDDDNRCPQFAIDALERADDDPAGIDVERSRRFVTQQHMGRVAIAKRCCSPPDSCEEMIRTRLESDDAQSVGRRQRMAYQIGDDLHVLARGQARNEVIELKDEADVLAAIGR
jgi:hypothetical protein